MMTSLKKKPKNNENIRNFSLKGITKGIGEVKPLQFTDDEPERIR